MNALLTSTRANPFSLCHDMKEKQVSAPQSTTEPLIFALVHVDPSETHPPVLCGVLQHCGKSGVRILARGLQFCCTNIWSLSWWPGKLVVPLPWDFFPLFLDPTDSMPDWSTLMSSWVEGGVWPTGGRQ